eukprot:GSChrysophyteH1.ASY1.ANO1.255.1 assembled CDS
MTTHKTNRYVVLAGTLLCTIATGLALRRLFSPKGRNPFEKDTRRRPGPQEHDRHKRDARGVEFDTGIHYIGEMRNHTGIKFLLDQLSRGQLQWSNLEDDYDVVVLGSPSGDAEQLRRYPIMSGKDNYIKSLMSHFPSAEDAVSIRSYVHLLEQVRKEMLGFVSFKLLPAWLATFIARCGLTSFFTNLLEIAPHNPELRAVLSYSFGDYGTLPRDASLSGASEIAHTIAPTILESGGALFVRCRVGEIVTDGGRCVGIKLAKDGSIIEASTVISAAGIYNTFDKLLPSVPRAGAQHKLHVRHGVGGMSVFIALSGTAKDLGLRASNTWAFTSHQLDSDARKYLSRPAEKCADGEIPLLFVSFPSTKDPTWESRFPDVTTCQIITLADYSWFAKWNDDKCMSRGEAYEERKQKLGKQMWKQVLEMFPQLRGKETYFNVASPLTNNTYLNATAGEMYGVDHNVGRFSPEAALSLRPEVSRVSGLYLAGQDVFTCGFAGAAFGGLLAASTVLNRNVYADMMNLKARVPRVID